MLTKVLHCFNLTISSFLSTANPEFPSQSWAVNFIVSVLSPLDYFTRVSFFSAIVSQFYQSMVLVHLSSSFLVWKLLLLSDLQLLRTREVLREFSYFLFYHSFYCKRKWWKRTLFFLFATDEAFVLNIVNRIEISWVLEQRMQQFKPFELISKSIKYHHHNWFIIITACSAAKQGDLKFDPYFNLEKGGEISGGF